jgi:Tfp pilus assembly protein PilX
MRLFMNNRIPNTVKHPASEQGFAIPIAMGMGLVMLLLAMTAIVRSQSDARVAVDRKFSAQARTAAEIGVTRVQDFLNRYRAAATAPACTTWPTSGYGDCNDSGATISWDVPGNITNYCPAASSDPVQMFANNNWKSAGTVGEYRLVDYAGSSGVLTVEGRINGGDTNEARSRLQVIIPVTQPTGMPVSSLWVTGTISGTSPNNPQINSDVVGTSSTCVSAGNVTFPPSTTNKLLNVSTPQSMPAAKPKPTTSPVPYTLASISGIPGKELPRSTATGYTANDAADTDGVYKYVVTSFDGSFNVTPGKKVWLWVNGDINLSDKIIINQCGATSGSPATLVNPNCGPFDVRIYPATSSTQTLTLNKGTAVCDIFFHLPDYAVTYNNSGTVTTQDCGGSTKNTGVYWVKSWSGAVASTTVIDPPRATWGAAVTAVNLTSFTMPPIAPQIGPVSQWATQSN